MLETIHILLLTMGLALFGVASLQDWALRLVPNRVPAAIAGLALPLRALDGTLLSGLAVAGAIFVLAALCWRRGWLGGADVKLFGAGALLVPPGAAATFILASCLAGGVLALFYAVIGYVVPPPAVKRPANLIRRYLRLEQRRLRRKGPLPYATAISAGVCFVLLGG